MCIKHAAEPQPGNYRLLCYVFHRVGAPKKRNIESFLAQFKMLVILK